MNPRTGSSRSKRDTLTQNSRRSRPVPAASNPGTNFRHEVLGSVAALLLAILLLSSRAHAQLTQATLLEPTGLERWTQAEKRLGAELKAAQVTLRRQSIDVASPEALLRTLEQGAFGRIAFVKEGVQGVAYVGLGNAGVERLVAFDINSELAADTLVLGAVEVLNTHALHIKLPATPRDTPHSAIPTRPRDEHRPISLSLEFGPLTTSGLSRPGWVVALGVQVPISALGGIQFELLGHYTAFPALSVSDAGRAEVTTLDARGYISLPVLDVARTTWDVGVGAGPLRASTQVLSVNSDAGFGIAQNANDKTAIMLSARSRLAFWLRQDFGVLVAVEPGFILPKLQIFASEERVAQLGRLWINAQLGVALGI